MLVGDGEMLIRNEGRWRTLYTHLSPATTVTKLLSMTKDRRRLQALVVEACCRTFSKPWFCSVTSILRSNKSAGAR